MIKAKTKKYPRIRQGDIYKNVEMIEYIEEKKGDLRISKIQFPYIMVLTQDCDLERDYFNRRESSEKPDENQDKFLFSALVAPLFNSEHFKNGEHFTDLDITMRRINWDRTEGQKIRNNEIPRYHYLEFPDDIPIVNSVIDFKHFFSINIGTLNKIKTKNFVCSISELFREDISHRFAFYLSRIGLPFINMKSQSSSKKEQKS